MKGGRESASPRFKYEQRSRGQTSKMAAKNHKHGSFLKSQDSSTTVTKKKCKRGGLLKGSEATSHVPLYQQDRMDSAVASLGHLPPPSSPKSPPVCGSNPGSPHLQGNEFSVPLSLSSGFVWSNISKNLAKFCWVKCMT
jgi:hypothetical protein